MPNIELINMEHEWILGLVVKHYEKAIHKQLFNLLGCCFGAIAETITENEQRLRR